MMRIKQSLALLALLFAVLSCEQSDVQQVKAVDDSPVYMDLPVSANARQSAKKGAPYAVVKAEYLTTAESGQIGRTIYFSNVGNKQLADDFVPGLSLDGTNNISYYIDETRPSEDLNVAASSAAIARALSTWDGVQCSNPGIYRVPSSKKISTGYVSALLGFGGSFDYTADVVHAGWLPAAFFDLLGEQGSTYILGVTFTIVFTDANGNPTDVDGNGKGDVAWREIYFNDAFHWADGDHYDVETVALHESGHALSQEHFGTAFADAGTGALHFSPRAVMNAAYSGIQTTIGASDNAGHCSLWSDWPAN
ncbi:MAG TPA: hypothetical protein VFI14_08550 [Chryseosolibacter sp.]|nr:hypothetical protein [Chryseosolibacter sp.]